MKIAGIFQRHLNHADHLVLNLEVALTLSGFICILLNAVTFRYVGDHYLSLNWLWLAPLLFWGAFFSSSWLKMFPRAAYLLKSYCLYFLAFFAFLVMLNGVQYTPFPTVDIFLGAADHVLNIQEPLLMNWAYAHPILLTILKMAYNSLIFQWLLMPLILFILRKKQQFHFYLVTSLLAYLIGAAIYYFFPSIGPASIYSDKHFTQAQIDTVVNFKEIHQYLMVTTFDGGMIAFPSFHVLWSVITVYTLRKTPAAFFAPILVLNVIAIVATLFLGWNYAIDILCGIFVGLISIYIAHRLIQSKWETPALPRWET